MVRARLKAITLWQPWATLVAAGAKQYETRSWRTDYRGPLAIHAGKRETTDAVWLRVREPQVANRIRPFDFPLGAIIALAEIASINPTDKRRIVVRPLELELGDWTPGRWAWLLRRVRKLETPIPVRGWPWLWDFDERLLAPEDWS